MPSTSVIVIKSGDRFLHVDPDGASEYSWCMETATIFRSKEAAETTLLDMLRYSVMESRSTMEDIINKGQTADTTRRYRASVFAAELAFIADIKEMA